MTSTAVPARTRAAAKRRRLRLPRVGLHVFLIGTAILWLAPLAWAVFTSFRPYDDTATNGYVSVPETLSLDNYRNAWEQGEIPLHFVNSMIITLPAIALILFFASSVAFVVSRYSFWFNIPLLIFFMAANLLPQQVIITPLYQLYLRIALPGWLSNGSGLMYDSFFGLIAINVAFQVGFCTFVLSNYMKTIPRSLGEAARVDGAGAVRQFFGIILPLCKPALAALATLEFTWIYNDFLWAVVLMGSGDKRPITSSLTNLQGTFFTDTNLISAASVLVAIPTVVVFLALQRHFIGGLTLGANKGMTRIAFIGAGSVVFTKNLLGDILALPALRDVEIALHDIDADRLATAAAMAEWVAGRREARPRISTHDERRAAIDGADFVINMVQIGGHEATLRDFELPARYGLRQSIADTLGVGGIFRTLRTAPHMLALGRELAELCPEAWLLNYTNPMAALCQLVYQGTPTTQVVGLCHSVQATVRDLAQLVGLPHDEVTFLSAGINHQAFLLRFEHDGESLYPRLDERIAGDLELQRRVRVALYRRFGYFQTESSEHAAEYVPWLMRHDVELERYRIPVGEYIQRSEDNLVEFERVKEALAAGESMPLERSTEYAATIVNSMVTGEPSVIYGNVPNTGLIPGLPDGTCVEVPCVVERNGLRPTQVLDYPPQLAALNRTYANVVELTVRAVLEERPDYVRIAALLDPNTSATLTLDEVDALCDELTLAHGELIPAGLRGSGIEAIA